ncbi:MAG: hypothetical protein B6U69_03490 [Thermofilum sp. ex4484_15]|nr:MAG: hypothetical protein B6U69_03490 [Thermofilum sp. ex4484_15]
MVVESEIRCCKCGSKEVLAKIGGKYYCVKCGREVVMKHLLSQIESLERSMLKPEGSVEK